MALFLCCLSKCRYFRFFDFPIFRFSDFPFFSRHFVLSVLVQFRMFRCFAVSIRFLPTLPPDRRGVSLPACGVLLLPDREERVAPQNVPPPPPVRHPQQPIQTPRPSIKSDHASPLASAVLQPLSVPAQAFSPAVLFVGHPVWYVSSLEEGVSAMVSPSSQGTIS